MIEDFQRLLDDYQRWLRDKTALKEHGDWVEITTPFLDRHNDYLQIYAQRQNGSYLLTDDGHTMQDLIQSGCKLDSPKRQQILRAALNGFGVKIGEGQELQVKASENSFPLQKHNLLQAMLAVSDMFYLAAPVVENLFYEDVVAWLDENEVRYTPNVKFTGKSGYDHLFDFVIPKSRKRPERIVQTVTRPGRESAEIMAFAWFDTREVRPPASQAYAMLNDTERTVSPAILEAMRSYDIHPVLWSGRDEVRDELAA